MTEDLIPEQCISAVLLPKLPYKMSLILQTPVQKLSPSADSLDPQIEIIHSNI